MADSKAIFAFATAWCDKFRNPRVKYTDLIDTAIGDNCEAFGFTMDCGHAFEAQYGAASHDAQALNGIIDKVDDIPLLGSAIYARWRYFSHWAYDPEEIEQPDNRAWFVLAFARLANLTGECPFLFQGTLRKIRIVSNRLGYGVSPDPGDEVEQCLTLRADGRVWLTSYRFDVDAGNYKKAKARTFAVSQTIIDHIFDAIASYFVNGYTAVFATDIGDWKMELTNTEGEMYRLRGALCADFDWNGNDLSDLIRGELQMPNLYVFDGNSKPDKVTRLCVDYHRITQIKPKHPVSSELEFVTWDYSEKLILDRESDTIEQTQNVGTGCVVSRKVYVDGAVAALLDEIDPEQLFGEIEGDPDDVVTDPLETRTYRITVDFQKAPRRIICGTYDKKALPEHWGAFADEVLQFVHFYDYGEILSPSVYGKARRRKQDHIYCSVVFAQGSQSYYYIADDDSIQVGDHVVVPVGRGNHPSVAEVVMIEYFSDEDVPFPIEKTKHILRKCTEDDIP